jgi:Flp pilus assembly protein TadD
LFGSGLAGFTHWHPESSRFRDEGFRVSNSTVHLDRGIMLRSQGRNEMAVDEFRQHLLEAPDDPDGHIQLSLALTELKKFSEARPHAEQAIALVPDSPLPHFALAHCAYREGKRREARAAIEEAIRLDAHDPDLFNLRGWIHFQESRWTEALADANAGLEDDPDHVGCLNLRAQALVMSKDRKSAAATLGKALQRHPDDASLHANTGWACLERGEPKLAMEHFREALRLEPNLEWARRGIVEAMKARHFIYRLFLRWLFAMMKLPPRVQIGIVVGALIGINVAVRLDDRYPALKPFVWPALIAYLAFAVLTWVAEPVFNLVLGLSRFGRLALSPKERREAYIIGASIAVSIALVTWMVWSGDRIRLLLGGVPAILSIIAVAAVLKTPPLKPRLIVAATAILWAGLNIYIANSLVEVRGVIFLTKSATRAEEWTTPLFLAVQFLSQYFQFKEMRR